jgi:hypothetical protein
MQPLPTSAQLSLDAKTGASHPITITGMDDLNKQLARLSSKDGKKAIRRAMRASLKPMKAMLRVTLPLGETGVLRRAVKIKAARGKRGEIRLTVGLGDKSFKGGKYYGSFRILGTKKMKGSDAYKQTFAALATPTREDAERRILAEVLALIESNSAPA